MVVVDVARTGWWISYANQTVCYRMDKTHVGDCLMAAGSWMPEPTCGVGVGKAMDPSCEDVSAGILHQTLLLCC